jgi:probable rRNA maturation factor
MPARPVNVIIFRRPVTGLSEASLARFVTRARRVARLKKKANVLVTTSRELQELNRRFRGKNRPTDVLSFPEEPGIVDFAGDVAISADIASRNAAELGHTTAAEIKILALHGILHLAGYDHERDEGEMARKEERMRKVLGLPGGLIGRNEAGEPTPTRRASSRRPIQKKH